MVKMGVPMVSSSKPGFNCQMVKDRVILASPGKVQDSRKTIKQERCQPGQRTETKIMMEEDIKKPKPGQGSTVRLVTRMEVVWVLSSLGICVGVFLIIGHLLAGHFTSWVV